MCIFPLLVLNLPMWGIHIVVSVHTNTHREGSLLVSCQPKTYPPLSWWRGTVNFFWTLSSPLLAPTVGGHVTCLMRKWRNFRWSSSAHLTFSLGERSALLQSGYDRLAHGLMLIFSIRKTFPLTPHYVFLPSLYSMTKGDSWLPSALLFVLYLNLFRIQVRKGVWWHLLKISTFN